jgi:hypothetical protein
LGRCGHWKNQRRIAGVSKPVSVSWLPCCFHSSDLFRVLQVFHKHIYVYVFSDVLLFVPNTSFREVQRWYTFVSFFLKDAVSFPKDLKIGKLSWISRKELMISASLALC